MFRFKDENKNKTINSLRKFPDENAYEITYYGDYALDEYLKCGAAEQWSMLNFQTEYLYEGVRNDFFYQNKHDCSGFTACNTNGDFLLCHNLDNPEKLPGVTLAENAVTGKTIGLSNLLFFYRFRSEWEAFSDLSVEKPVDCARVLGTPYEVQDGMNSHGLALVTFTASGTEVETDGKKIPLCYYSLYRAIIDRCKGDVQKAAFFVRKTIQNNWSRAVLMNFLDSDLYERQGKAISNFHYALPAEQSDLAQEMTKDPYNFDFLTIQADYNEAQLKDALMNNITKFLMELGRGFSFVGREYPLPIEGTEERIDLLFYHLWLHCYVVIEVKVKAFAPADIGQTATYVAIADDLIRQKESFLTSM